MLSKSLVDSINEQIKSELYSSNLYLSMSAYSDSLNLTGFAKFFHEQSEEEREHALKLFDYLLDRNAQVEIRAIDEVPSRFSSVEAMCKAFYDHEKVVTSNINDLYHLAQNENDYPTQVILQWFITEQIEEEKTALTLLERVRMAGDDAAALLIIDGELAESEGEETVEA